MTSLKTIGRRNLTYYVDMARAANGILRNIPSCSKPSNGCTLELLTRYKSGSIVSHDSISAL
jgi:hypothetical protein